MANRTAHPLIMLCSIMAISSDTRPVPAHADRRRRGGACDGTHSDGVSEKQTRFFVQIPAQWCLCELGPGKRRGADFQTVAFEILQHDSFLNNISCAFFFNVFSLFLSLYLFGITRPGRFFSISVHH